MVGSPKTHAMHSPLIIMMGGGNIENSGNPKCVSSTIGHLVGDGTNREEGDSGCNVKLTSV